MKISLDQKFLTQVKAAQAGDIQAFEALVQRTNTLVNTLALAVCRDADKANDISQLVYLNVWRKIGRLKQPESFLPWLRQLTRHQALNSIRERASVSDEFDCELLVCQSPTPDDFWHSEKLKHQFTRLVEALPDNTREVLILYYREQESVSQVANLLELTEDTVKKRLQRGREMLKGSITEDYRSLLTASFPIGVVSIVSLIGKSAPATAGVLSATAKTMSASSSLSSIGILKLALGGMVGVAAGAGAQFFGLQPLIERTQDHRQKTKLLRLRRVGLLCSLISGILFTVSYIWTRGWIFPVATYLLFVIGVVITTLSVWRIARTQWQHDKWYRYLGLWGGLIAGFSGLVAGLLQSGRLIL